MSLVIKAICIMFCVSGLLFVYNTLRDRYKHKKEIEKLNKQLEKYGKRPISYK